MNAARVFLFSAFLFSLTTLASSADAANRSRYAWGWQKPLNQKVGSAFYTGNRAFYRDNRFARPVVRIQPAQRRIQPAQRRTILQPRIRGGRVIGPRVFWRR